LRPFDASGLATLDDVGDQKSCIDRFGVNERVRIGALGEVPEIPIDELPIDAVVVAHE
jgi:hypothetical protein